MSLLIDKYYKITKKTHDNQKTTKQEYICKEELDLDWQKEDELCAHDNTKLLVNKSIDVNSLNDATNTFCDSNGNKNFLNNKDLCEIGASSSAKPKQKNKLWNAVVVLEKLPEHKSYNKGNIDSRSRSTKNNVAKSLMVRFCKNCKQTIATNFNPTIPCPKCKGVLNYKCKKCSKHTISYAGMLYHLNSTCQSQGHYYQCPGCPYKRGFKTAITEHMKNMHKNLPISDVIVISSQDLQKDLKSVEIYKCSKCSAQYKHFFTLNRHSKVCSGIKNQIPFKGKDEDENENSSSEVLKDQPDPGPEALLVLKMANLYCKKCNKKAALNIYNSKKCKDCTSTLMYECSKCENRCESRNGILTHLKAKCAAQGMYFCPKCDYQSPSKIYVTQHYKSVHESIPVECWKCKSVLKNKTTLYGHLIHCKKGPHLCAKCGKKLKNKITLKNHLNSCGNEPRFHCTLCIYKSHRKFHLKQHMIQAHFKDEHKYPACPKCDAKFENKLCSNAHLRFCGTSKPHFQCDYCPYKCGHKRQIKNHITRWHLQNNDIPHESDVDVIN